MQSNLAETYDDEFMEDEEQGPWKFEDAPEEVKTRILDKQRYFEVDDRDWWDCTYEGFKMEMKGKGINIDEIHFSGFCSQGDRASFQGDIDDLGKFLETFCKPEDYQAVRKLMNFDNFTFSFRSISHDYDRCYFEYEWEDWRNLIEYDEDDLRYSMMKVLNLFNQADEELYKLATHAEGIFNQAMRDVYRQLETEYDYLTSDDCIIEALTANDYFFDEDGDITH